MNLLIGNKSEFFEFISKITEKDKVAILTHDDPDGIVSAVFLTEILKSKGLKINYLDFLRYSNDCIKKILPKLKEKGINKLFITDVSVDNLNLLDFNKLREDIDTFLIDHHPTNPLLKDKKNIIKAESNDCAALVIYRLCPECFKDKKWRLLVCSTCVNEFSYREPENLKFVQKFYPDVNEKNVLESDIGIFSDKLSCLCIYFYHDLKNVYDILLKKEFFKVEKYYGIIKKDIDSFIEKFFKEAEYYKDKDLYFYYAKSKFFIQSYAISLISAKKPDGIFVIVYDDNEDKNFLKISFRNQSKRASMNEFSQKTIKGLMNSNAGGHVAASGGRIQKKDLDKFKENLLNSFLICKENFIK